MHNSLQQAGRDPDPVDADITLLSIPFPFKAFLEQSEGSLAGLA